MATPKLVQYGYSKTKYFEKYVVLFVNYHFKYYICQLPVLLGTKNFKNRKIIFKTAKGLRAFFTDRLARKQVWGKLGKIYCCGIC